MSWIVSEIQLSSILQVTSSYILKFCWVDCVTQNPTLPYTSTQVLRATWSGSPGGSFLLLRAYRHLWANWLLTDWQLSCLHNPTITLYSISHQSPNIKFSFFHGTLHSVIIITTNIEIPSLLYCIDYTTPSMVPVQTKNSVIHSQFILITSSSHSLRNVFFLRTS